MFYIIVDPGQDYAMHMMRFLDRFGLKAIAVFTAPQEYQHYQYFAAPQLADMVADEFLSTEFPSIEALADRISEDVQGELVGIIPWAEFTILFGAELGQHLGLGWNPPEIIRRFRNKFTMKEALRQAGGIRINASRVVSTVEEAEEFVEAIGHWPVVVKPAEGAGSMAVSFVHSMDELIEAAQKVFAQGTGEILLEEFIGGTEYVANGVTDSSGEVLITDVWRYDKRDVGPHKNLYHQTIKVNTHEPMWLDLARYATRAVHALGLRNAPVHMELKIDDYGPCMIEVGARFAGGNQPMLASELHGRSLFELAACHYLSAASLSWDDVHYDRYDSLQARIVSGVQTWHLDRVSQIIGLEEVRHLPSFFGFGKLMPLGSAVPVTTDLLSKCYEVYLIHEDPHQIEHDARAVRHLLRYA